MSQLSGSVSSSATLTETIPRPEELLEAIFAECKGLSSSAALNGPEGEGYRAVFGYADQISRVDKYPPALIMVDREGLSPTQLAQYDRVMEDWDYGKGLRHAIAYRKEKMEGLAAQFAGKMGDANQHILRSLLSAPTEIYAKSGATACEVTVFRMLVESLTGVSLPEEAIYAAGRNSGLSHPYLDGEVFDPGVLERVFQTETFRRYFGYLNIQIEPFIGADFAFIASHARELREQGYSVYCTVPVNSFVHDGATHQLILLEVSDDQVTFVDPNPIATGQIRRIPKADFVQRWAARCCMGAFYAVKDQ